MKTCLNVSGRVELDRSEVTAAIFEYLKIHYNYKPTKVVYENCGTDKFSAVVEIVGTVLDEGDAIHDYHVKQKQHRKSPESHVRKNIGLYPFIKEYLLDERKIGNRIVTYETLFKIVQDFFPEMTMERLQIYLLDKREFGNFTIDSKNKIIKL